VGAEAIEDTQERQRRKDKGTETLRVDTGAEKKQVSQPAYHGNLAFVSGAPGWDTIFSHHFADGERDEYPISTC
jgi:hypothetical protein